MKKLQDELQKIESTIEKLSIEQKQVREKLKEQEAKKKAVLQKIEEENFKEQAKENKKVVSLLEEIIEAHDINSETLSLILQDNADALKRSKEQLLPAVTDNATPDVEKAKNVDESNEEISNSYTIM